VCAYPEHSVLYVTTLQYAVFPTAFPGLPHLDRSAGRFGQQAWPLRHSIDMHSFISGTCRVHDAGTSCCSKCGTFSSCDSCARVQQRAQQRTLGRLVRRQRLVGGHGLCTTEMAKHKSAGASSAVAWTEHGAGTSCSIQYVATGNRCVAPLARKDGQAH